MADTAFMNDSGPSDLAGVPSPTAVAPTSGVAPSVARKEPPKNGIAISENAAKFARQRLIKRGTPDAAIRLGVKGGSCSGYSYVIQYEDKEPRERDYVYEKDGIRFIVDKKSFLFLAGSTLEYENTLMFQGFKFVNPQETQKCGCGHSFNVR